MRYDDRLETIMNARTRDAAARAAMWVQLVDVLAQDRGSWPDDLRANAYRWLEKWRDDVPERRRVAAAAAIGGRALPIELVDFFARDTAQVAAPVLTRATPDAAGWSARLSQWPSASRSILAERTDLPAALVRDLASLGPQQLALPPSDAESPFPPLAESPETIPPARDPEDIWDLPAEAVVEASTPSEPLALEPAPAEPVAAPEPQPATPVQPIGALLERIERYRSEHPGRRPSSATSQEPSRAFVFEADRTGRIVWVEGAPRGALIGLSLADMALPGECGVDGQAAGAFRKRARFEHARLFVEGHGSASGDWLMSGDPVFDRESGRFLGYQGQARRLAENKASSDAPGELLGGSLRPASVRQLVHELRTPLNAIRGFAEMIEGQFLGPVAEPYRARATSIIRDSQSLLRVFEDLESAARLETGDYQLSPTARTSLPALAREIFAAAETLVQSHELNLKVSLADELPDAAVDDATSRRLLDGFVDLLAGVAARGEQIDVSLRSHDGAALLEARSSSAEPRASWEWNATVTDDPGSKADVLPLGLGYKFRLLSRLAERVGGGLHASGNRLSLLLPLAAATEDQSARG